MERNKKKQPLPQSIPHNDEAEIYVLGSVIIDNRIMGLLDGKIRPNDFFVELNQQIYEAMISLHKRKQKIEIITIREEFTRLELPSTPELQDYLLEIVDAVPATSNIQIYIDIVEEKSIERSLLEKMGEISDDIRTNSLEFNDLLDKTEDTITEVIKRRRTNEFITLSEVAGSVYEDISRISETGAGNFGLITGYPNLDRVTLGFQKGDLMILAARPAVGKSSYAINLALNACLNNPGAHIAYFSLEMSKEQIMMRIFSNQADIDLSKIRSGNLDSEELLLLGLAKQRLDTLNIYFDESSSTNIADIRAKCRQLHQANKLDFIIIDYLQLITVESSKGNRQEEVSKISRSLKTIARELNVPILALSQLSRSIETRENKEPVLADLRESGSIEQDADLVMFLFARSDVEPVDTESEDFIQSELNDRVNELSGKKSENGPKEVVLSIAKNRQGSLAYFDYHFYGNVSRFIEQTETKPLIRKKKRSKKQK